MFCHQVWYFVWEGAPRIRAPISLCRCEEGDEGGAQTSTCKYLYGSLCSRGAVRNCLFISCVLSRSLQAILHQRGGC